MTEVEIQDVTSSVKREPNNTTKVDGMSLQPPVYQTYTADCPSLTFIGCVINKSDDTDNHETMNNNHLHKGRSDDQKTINDHLNHIVDPLNVKNTGDKCGDCDLRMLGRGQNPFEPMESEKEELGDMAITTTGKTDVSDDTEEARSTFPPNKKIKRSYMYGVQSVSKRSKERVDNEEGEFFEERPSSTPLPDETSDDDCGQLQVVFTSSLGNDIDHEYEDPFRKPSHTTSELDASETDNDRMNVNSTNGIEDHGTTKDEPVVRAQSQVRPRPGFCRSAEVESKHGQQGKVRATSLATTTTGGQSATCLSLASWSEKKSTKKSEEGVLEITEHNVGYNMQVSSTDPATFGLSTSELEHGNAAIVIERPTQVIIHEQVQVENSSGVQMGDNNVYSSATNGEGAGSAIVPSLGAVAHQPQLVIREAASVVVYSKKGIKDCDGVQIGNNNLMKIERKVMPQEDGFVETCFELGIDPRKKEEIHARLSDEAILDRFATLMAERCNVDCTLESVEQGCILLKMKVRTEADRLQLIRKARDGTFQQVLIETFLPEFAEKGIDVPINLAIGVKNPSKELVDELQEAVASSSHENVIVIKIPATVSRSPGAAVTDGTSVIPEQPETLCDKAKSSGQPWVQNGSIKGQKGATGGEIPTSSTASVCSSEADTGYSSTLSREFWSDSDDDEEATWQNETTTAPQLPKPSILPPDFMMSDLGDSGLGAVDLVLGISDRFTAAVPKHAQGPFPNIPGADDRKRLRNFYIGHLDAGDVPGVTWMDRSTGLFRIVWRHAGMDGFDPERDGLIFKLWAQQTGRWKEGDPEDTTTWKMCMRNALRRLADFQEEQDMGKPDDPHEAFRVYRLVPPPSNPPRQPESIPEPSILPLDVIMDDLGDSDSAMNCLTPDGLLGHFHGLDMASPAPSEDCVQGSYAQPQPIAANVAPQQNVYHATDGATATLPEQTRGPFQNLLDGDVKISVQYRGRQVLEESHSNPSGVRIYHGSPVKEFVATQMIPGDGRQKLYGPENATHVLLPPCEPHMHSPKQLDITRKLLKHTERGVVLQFLNGDVWATRLCQTKVFWLDPNKPDMSLPMKLDRDVPTKVFDFVQGFLPLLQNYARNVGGSKKPRPYFKMCFGQSWSTEDPFEGNLIAVTVQQLTAETNLNTVNQYRQQDDTSHLFPLSEIPVWRENPEDQLIEQLEQLIDTLPKFHTG